MNYKLRRGFSLIEVLMAVGTLAIGMIFIGGTFLVAIHLTTVSSERTIATIVANEAFAKVRLYGVDLNDPNLGGSHQWPFADLTPLVGPRPVNPNEFAYPSTRTLAEKQYFWSALCRELPSDPNHDLQVTVFISRKVGVGTVYIGPPEPMKPMKVMDRPVPMWVEVIAAPGDTVITINNAAKVQWISDGYTIVEDSTGERYRVIERAASGIAEELTLDPAKPWLGGDKVWAVPPPMIPGSVPPAVRGRGPCIAVYQTKIKF